MCRNGSLITIFRNCFLPGGKGCQGESDADSAGVGGKRFFYSISNDGKHQTAPSKHTIGVTISACWQEASGGRSHVRTRTW